MTATDVSTRSSPRRIAFRTVGDLAITLGVVLALFVVYETWGKVAVINDHQTRLDRQLESVWSPPPPAPAAPPEAEQVREEEEPLAIGRLHVPRLGLRWVLVEGVDKDDIRFAPGHYPGTAQPGQLGNMAVAGHRSPGLFWDLDQVAKGDPIVVETADTWFVYRVTRTRIVLPRAADVVAPVPDQPGTAPTAAVLTLTTCEPKWDDYQRLVVHARLARATPKIAGRPAELGG